MSDKVSVSPNSRGATIQRAVANIAASQTATTLVAAVSGKIIRVISFAHQCGATGTTITYNSDSSAITPLFPNGANGGGVFTDNEKGWFETDVGEALTVTTGAGSTTAILVGYILVNP